LSGLPEILFVANHTAGEIHESPLRE
jgi:hypothetical protein